MQINFKSDMDEVDDPDHIEQWLEIAPELNAAADQAYTSYSVVCPTEKNVFRAFSYFNPLDTRVVILGQDPYHSVMEVTTGLTAAEHNLLFKAWGLSFGYNPEWPGPLDSSLGNVVNEVLDTCGGHINEFDRSLESWAKQGVLLLNTRLTVEFGKPMSHSGVGWDKPITAILKYLYEHTDCVFMLWGSEAKQFFAKATSMERSDGGAEAKKEFAKATEEPDVPHRRNEAGYGNGSVLWTSHPCKFSAHRGFIGCNHFKLANEYLRSVGEEAVKWI